MMKKSLLLAAASLAVISCSKRTIEAGGGEEPTGPQQVRFSSSMNTIAVTKVIDTLNHSLFENKDEIGVYAVLHGEKLGTPAAVPTNTEFQYLNRLYKVSNTPVYDKDDADTSIAEFLPGTASENMYYMAGNQGWNYYAYYPTTGGVITNMPSTPTNVGDAAAFEKKDEKLLFQNQLSGTYPGPFMFAYYNKKDTAVPYGQAQKPVALQFKYAVAKISITVEVSKTAGKAGDMTAVMLCGTGLKAGIVFDLTKATAKDVTTKVYSVITQNPVGAPLDGKPLNASSGLPQATTNGYQFNFKATLPKSNKDAADNNGKTDPLEKLQDSTILTSTGYLIPAGNENGITEGTGTLKNAEIHIFKGSGATKEVFIAKLDKTNDAVPGKNYLERIEPGKEYKYKILISKTGVTFTGTIEDWTVVDNTADPIPAE